MCIEQSRADGQSMLVKQDPYNQARRQRSERSFPRLLGADARRHQVAANESADEIGKDVSCPNHQQDEKHPISSCPVSSATNAATAATAGTGARSTRSNTMGIRTTAVRTRLSRFKRPWNPSRPFAPLMVHFACSNHQGHEGTRRITRN